MKNSADFSGIASEPKPMNTEDTWHFTEFIVGLTPLCLIQSLLKSMGRLFLIKTPCPIIWCYFISSVALMDFALIRLFSHGWDLSAPPTFKRLGLTNMKEREISWSHSASSPAWFCFHCEEEAWVLSESIGWCTVLLTEWDKDRHEHFTQAYQLGRSGKNWPLIQRWPWGFPFWVPREVPIKFSKARNLPHASGRTMFSKVALVLVCPIWETLGLIFLTNGALAVLLLSRCNSL